MSSRSMLLVFSMVLLGATLYFFSKDSKSKQGVHDEKHYIQFCHNVVAQEKLYQVFRSHPLYKVFQENLNEESAQDCLKILETKYPHLLQMTKLITELDRIGAPLKIMRSTGEQISYPTLRNLKIAGDIQAHFASFEGKTIVQIGAADGSLCKIVHDLQKPARYCLVDIAPALELAKKTLSDWGNHNIEFYTLEEFIAPDSIDLVVSPFVFTESRRNVQGYYFTHILKHAQYGYLDCRFPMRHFGLKVQPQEKIISELEKMGKNPYVLSAEPVTNIDSCLILYSRLNHN